MIHIGALVAVLIVDFVHHYRTKRGSQIDRYQYKEEKRTIIAMCACVSSVHVRLSRVTLIRDSGAGAGVAAAFRAPIGGVLFAVEEAISFFSSKFIFRCYVVRCRDGHLGSTRCSYHPFQATALSYYFLQIIEQKDTLNPKGFTTYGVGFNCDLGYQTGAFGGFLRSECTPRHNKNKNKNKNNTNNNIVIIIIIGINGTHYHTNAFSSVMQWTFSTSSSSALSAVLPAPASML
jgi:H+/Cl- antiporter ClcA